jgi:hypothetical protein
MQAASAPFSGLLLNKLSLTTGSREELVAVHKWRVLKWFVSLDLAVPGFFEITCLE